MIQVLNQQALGTLPAADLAGEDLVLASDNEYRVISITTDWNLVNHTPGEGPITVGYAHGDYTDTEIEEWYEGQNDILRGDKIAAEISQRFIRRAGMFSGVAASETLNDGRSIKTRLNWVIAEGKTVRMWAYNGDVNALTTGTVLTCSGRMYMRFL